MEIEIRENILEMIKKAAIQEEVIYQFLDRLEKLSFLSDVDPVKFTEKIIRACEETGKGESLLENDTLLRVAGINTNDLNNDVHIHSNIKIGVFGWGLVAPGTKNVDLFRRKIREGRTWLAPMIGFGPNNFYAGKPDFNFEDYKEWFEKRNDSARFAQIEKKMGLNVKYAIGAYIQALEQNPGIEDVLNKFSEKVHVYVTTSQGDIPLEYEVNIEYYRAQRVWDKFWAQPENCMLRNEYESLDGKEEKGAMRMKIEAPEDPSGMHYDDEGFDAINDAWNSYWAAKSEKLHKYLEKSRAIHDKPIERDVERIKTLVIKKRLIELKKLREEYRCPPEPWASVSQNRLWNIDNIPAAQITMIGKLTGPHISPVDACTSFIVALEMASDAIKNNKAKIVVVGVTDPDPHPINVGTFYDAKVLTCDGKVSRPLSHLKGTHVSGGSVIWIVGDIDFMVSLGMRPLGAEIVTTALNSDAEHIITPSKEMPRQAIRMALKKAKIKPEDVETFDLHATATPGDWAEIESVHAVLGDTPYLTARKGIFGHGMGVVGGWELTAQYMGIEEGLIFKTMDKAYPIHVEINEKHPKIVADKDIPYKGGYAGKINLGVGGINGVVISKPLDFDLYPFQFARLGKIEMQKIKEIIENDKINFKKDKYGYYRIPYREFLRWEKERNK